MYFGHNDFSRAENLLTEGEVDPREVSVLNELYYTADIVHALMYLYCNLLF